MDLLSKTRHSVGLLQLPVNLFRGSQQAGEDSLRKRIEHYTLGSK
jgi:hypothetical protein